MRDNMNASLFFGKRYSVFNTVSIPSDKSWLSVIYAICIRINAGLKERAEVLFNELGLSMTTAVNVFCAKQCGRDEFPLKSVWRVQPAHQILERAKGNEACSLPGTCTVTLPTSCKQAFKQLGSEDSKTIIHADPLPVNFRSKEEKPKDTEGHLPPLC